MLRKQGERTCRWSKQIKWLSVQITKYTTNARLKSKKHLLISMPLQSVKIFVAKFALKNVIPYPHNGCSFDIGRAILHASFYLTP
jgi:hypothetical protein